MKTLYRGITWNVLGSVVAQGCGFTRVIVVAASIGPEGMGVFAIAGSILAAIGPISEFGVRQTYIASTTHTEQEEQTLLGSAWAADIALKWAMVVFAIPAAWLASRIMGNDQLTAFVVLLTMTMALSSLTNPALLRGEKAGHFGYIAFCDASAQVVGLVTAVLVVLQTQTAWALVLGGLAGSVAQVLISYVVLRFPESLHVSSSAVRRLLWQGRHFVVISFTMFITYSLDKLLIGAFVSARSAGLFFMAQRIAEIPSIVFLMAVGRTVLPHYSACYRAGGTASLWREVRRVLIWTTLTFALAILAYLGAWALDLPQLLSADWRAALPFMPYLLIGVAARCACGVTSPALIPRGEIHIDSRYKIQEALIYLVFLPASILIYDANGAVFSFIAMYCIALARRIAAVRRSVVLDGNTNTAALRVNSPHVLTVSRLALASLTALWPGSAAGDFSERC